MAFALGAVPAAAIAGLVIAVVVVAGLIYGAIDQYRRSQARIAERRRLAAEEAERTREARRQDLVREAAFGRIAFETQRTRVREERPALVAGAAAVLGDLGPRWEATSLLVPLGWMLAHPLHLDPDAGAVGIRAVAEPGQRAPAVLREALRLARPLTADGLRHERIIDAIVELEDPPASKYVNRDCYRIVDFEVAGDGARLELVQTTYFEALNEAIPLECEVAEALRPATEGVPAEPVALPIRAALGDPFALGNRTTVGSVSTLVLRRAADGTAEFWLHARRTVGMVGGQTHVVPTGVFQPAVDADPAIFARDAAPWHTVLRELTEELLGVWDADARAVAPDAYDTQPPLADIEAARRDGTARPWLVGAGLDPLSYWFELLTVLVVDADTFDAIVGQPPRENREGTVLGVTRPDGTHGGHPFTAAGVAAALADERLAPAADALIQLAWKHADALLS
jgi:hypothetical protein